MSVPRSTQAPAANRTRTYRPKLMNRLHIGQVVES